jgi:hypothetical protein
METTTEQNQQPNIQTNQIPPNKSKKLRQMDNWQKCLSLQEPFAAVDLARVINISNNGANSQIRRWAERGLLKKSENGQYLRTGTVFENSTEGHKCNKCEKSFKSKQSLRVHLFRAHTKNGAKLSRKIGESNKTRIGEIRINKNLPIEHSPEIIKQDSHKLRFCPNCSCNLQFIEAALNFNK